MKTPASAQLCESFMVLQPLYEAVIDGVYALLVSH